MLHLIRRFSSPASQLVPLLTHVTIPCSELARSQEFYAGVFGLAAASQTGVNRVVLGSPHQCQLVLVPSASASDVGSSHATAPPQARPLTPPYLTVAVSNIKSATRQAVRH